MDESFHFDGDPAIDSSRRHMERVLRGDPGPRKWPWLLAGIASGGLWAVWRAAGYAQSSRPVRANADEPNHTAR